MADNVPRFMQSTKASQDKLSEAATNKKTKIPSLLSPPPQPLHTAPAADAAALR
jgi:hypothetical protein